MTSSPAYESSSITMNICQVSITAEEALILPSLESTDETVAHTVKISFAVRQDTGRADRHTLEIRTAPPPAISPQNALEEAKRQFGLNGLGELLSRFEVLFASPEPAISAFSERETGKIRVEVTDWGAVPIEDDITYPLGVRFVWASGGTIENGEMFSPKADLNVSAIGIDGDGVLVEPYHLDLLTKTLSPFMDDLPNSDKWVRLGNGKPPPALKTSKELSEEQTLREISVIKTPTIQRDPYIVHGAPSFPYTRVFISSMFSAIASGMRLDDFAEIYPHIETQTAVAALEACYENYKERRVLSHA